MLGGWTEAVQHAQDAIEHGQQTVIPPPRSARPRLFHFTALDGGAEPFKVIRQLTLDAIAD